MMDQLNRCWILFFLPFYLSVQQNAAPPVEVEVNCQGSMRGPVTYDEARFLNMCVKTWLLRWFLKCSGYS